MTSNAQLAIPNEMRAVAEQRIEHAKGAFADFMRVAQGAVSALEDRVTASQAGANEIGDKAMSFAERNVSSAFELAQKNRSDQGHPGTGPDANRVRSITDERPERAGEGLGRNC